MGGCKGLETWLRQMRLLSAGVRVISIVAFGMNGAVMIPYTNMHTNF